VDGDRGARGAVADAGGDVQCVRGAGGDGRRIVTPEQQFAFWQERLQREAEMAAAQARLELKQALIPIIACFTTAALGALYVWTL
jgi:hypothetical protein